MIAASRSGFTLMEVVVALVVSAMTVTAAAMLLRSLADRTETIRRAAVTVDRRENGERLLRQLVTNTESHVDSTPSFVGDSASVRFSTWCETSHGWLGRCKAELGFAHDTHESVLRLQLHGADSGTVTLGQDIGHGSFRYLLNAESRGTWLDRWSLLGPPEALAILLDSDTLFLPVRGGYW